MKQIIKALSAVIFLAGILQACSKRSGGGGSTTTTVGGTVTTIAGNGTAGYIDGVDSKAEFNNPGGLTLDAQGNLYVIDGTRIREISVTGIVSTVAGNDTSGYKDGKGINAEFRGPDAIAVDAQGNLYVGDAGNHYIRKITPSGDVTTLAGNGNYGYTDGTAASAEFENPDAITVDGQGNIYIGDFATSRIRKITPLGMVTTIAGNTNGFEDGPVISAAFYGPRGIAVDGGGNLYIVDCDNNRIRKIASSGEVTTIAGNGNAGLLDGQGINAEFNLPASMAIDANGNLYVADQSNNSIRKISTTGNVTTLAGNGIAGYAEGIGNKAEFNSPRGIGVDSHGNVYVGDLGNHLVRKISAN